MTRLNLVSTLALAGLAGLAGCEPPEHLDGPYTNFEVAGLVQVSQNAAGAAAGVWQVKPQGATSHSVFFFRRDGVSGWVGPTSLGTGILPDVALADSGRAIVVYSGKARVFDGATWGPTQTIEPSGVTMPNFHPVAVDSQGNGLVSFTGDGKAWVAEYDVATGWDPAQSLSSTATGEWTDVDMNATGEAVVAYCEANDRLIAKFRPVSGGNWVKKTLGTNCCHSIIEIGPHGYPIRVAISDAGDAMVIGSDWVSRVCSARYDHTTGWGSTTILTTAALSGFPSIAMNATGDAIAAWKDHGGHLRLRRYVLGSGWSATATGPRIGHAGLAVGMKDEIAAAVFGMGSTVSYVYQDDTGTVSDPVTIATVPGTGTPYYLDAASTPQGLGLVAWDQYGEFWVARRQE